jgi:Plasmid pRiA4b ORF-3-like protein
MAKKKASKPETKSDFLRRVLGRNPNLDYRQVNQRWAKAGHPGQISNPLYYLIRRELGIVTEWTWVRVDEPPPSKPARAAAPTEVYQFKVTLKETTPPIWRRIQVGDCSLDKLHEHIQTAMGWTNSHMNHFRIDETLYGDPLLVQQNFEEMQYRDSTTTMLSDIVPKDGGRFAFEYEYDFGDGWLHEVLFEGRLQADPGAKYPLCLEGARACPPEDVGGVWGYADFLEAIADPEHEEHRELLEWAGGKFDPEAFTPLAATRRMKKGLPDWRSMR